MDRAGEIDAGHRDEEQAGHGDRHAVADERIDHRLGDIACPHAGVSCADDEKDRQDDLEQHKRRADHGALPQIG
jgi:hypothetical protein